MRIVWGELLILCCVFLILFFLVNPFFLIEPAVWPDEALFADTALNLATTGELKTPVFEGVLDNPKSYWYHPLYFFVMSFWIRLSGFSIENLRFFSLLLSFLIIIFTYVCIRSTTKKISLAIAGIFFLILEPSFWKASHLVRPDILAVVFIVAGYTVFLRVGFLKFLFAGFMAGMAIVTHPLGVVLSFFLAIMIVLENGKLVSKFRNLAMMILPQLGLLSVWILFIGRDLNNFASQYLLQLKRKEEVSYFVGIIFQTDYLWSILLIGYLAVIIVIGILAFSRKEMNMKSAFVLCALISVAVVISKEMWYLVFIAPFIVISMMLGVENIRERGEYFKSGFYLLVFSILAIKVSIYFTNFTKPVGLEFDYYKFGKIIEEKLPVGSSVYIANIPDPYFVLKLNNKYKLFEFSPINLGAVRNNQILSQVDYMVMSFTPEQPIQKYIEDNQERVEQINFGGYTSYVIKLKPKELRKT